ncbi:hypothetical protein MNBD_GAMMA12-3540 [hydrothermal vent metagenome]|uniref:Glycosyltransferase n=1 Tax=hydrothermal vent metagenome TaxID=652676 RepID=A0A3B0Z5U7_9ZZZZ
MNILRVSTFPTIKKSGMGLHSYYLCNMKDSYTYFLTPLDEDVRLVVPGNTMLIEKYFTRKVRPREKNKLAQFFFQIGRVLSIIRFSLDGAKILFSKRIDVVHIHSPMYSMIAVLGWLLRKQVYITFHGSDFYRIKGSSVYRMFSFIYDGVFVISPDMIPYLAEVHGDDKIHQVENGIDSIVYVNKSVTRKKQIIGVGALKEEKGFNCLIDSFSLFLIAAPYAHEYKLVIVGEGLLRNTLQKQINDNGLSNFVSLVGHKTVNELVDLYNESEIFVLSSISEGFPKVLLEAISCGCKIVSTKVGSVPEILSNYEYLVDVCNNDDLANKIVSISQLKYVFFSNYYLEIKNRYEWDKVRETYESIYKACQ